MKKYHYLLIAVLLGITTCKKDDNSGKDPEPNGSAKEIVLTAPASLQDINLNETENVSFAWENMQGVSSYTLVLSLAQDLSAPQTLPAGNNPLAVPADELDAKAAALGIGEGNVARIFWTIRPSDPAVEVNATTRVINLTRIAPTIVLMEPADGAATVIDANTTTFPVTFRWKSVAGITGYIIGFSKDPTFPDEATLSFNKGSGTTHVFPTAQSFDNLLSDPILNGSGVVFWTVKPDVPDDRIITQARSFTGVQTTRTDIELTAPEDLASLDAESFPYVFSWLKISAVTSYRLKFSTAYGFPEGSNTIVMDAGNKGELTVTKAQWDNILNTFGTAAGEQKKVYWTVVSGAGNAGTSVRSLTAKRAEPRKLNRTGWTADATYGQASAANVLDGVPSTEWTVPMDEANANTNPNPPIQIVLDMKSNARVTAVAVSKTYGVGQVVISLSDDGATWGDALTPVEGHTMPDTSAENTWTTSTPERARYVKVSIVTQYGGQNIGVPEVAVTGYDF
jgi:hypothetical protein